MRLLCLSFVCLAIHVLGNDYFVSTDGTPSGTGASNSCWNLEFALTNSVITAGDNLWLRAGTYGYGSNLYYCWISGTEVNPIIVRNWNGERAIVNGTIYCGASANWTTFWGLEMTNAQERTNTASFRWSGLVLSNHGHKVRNMVFFNTGHPAISGGGSEIYGCIIWGTGIFEKDHPTYPTNIWERGSGMYLQNSGEVQYLVQDNITGRNMTYGMKAYAENGYANRFVFDSNVTYKNQVAGFEIDVLYNSITNASSINNFSYQNLKHTFGYYSQDVFAQHQFLTFSNNYIVTSPGMGSAAFWLKRWSHPTVVGNTFVVTSQTNAWGTGSGVGSGRDGLFFELYPSTNATTYNINSNAYYGGVEQGADWYAEGEFYHTYQPFRWKFAEVSPIDGTNGRLSFVAWTNAHGLDINSTYTTNMPTANVVAVRTNKYEQGRAHIIVYNWESNNTATVDFSQIGLTNGQPYEVRDAQNFLGTAAVTGTFNASSPNVELPLTLTEVSEVTGGIEGYYTFNPNQHTDSLFNVFVVLPTAAPVTRYTHTHGSGTLGASTR